MTCLPDNDCEHKNKKVTDCENMDGEVYYECPDCGAGWRQQPETIEDMKAADEIMELDARVLGVEKEFADYKKRRYEDMEEGDM